MVDRKGEVLDVAIAIADAEGLSSVSMRAIGRHMHVTAMALYVHVRDKDALLDGLVDRLLSEVELPDVNVPWEDRLTTLATNVRSVLLKHPWGGQLLFSRPVVSASGANVVETIYSALFAAGVPDAQIPRLERLISTAVIGLAASEVEGRFVRRTPESSKDVALSVDAFPAHRRLSEYLTGQRSTRLEFLADLGDLILMVKATATTVHPGNR